jgi:hypothetical protein
MTRVFFGGILFVFFCVASLFADTTLVDNQLNYSVYLPANWVREVENDSQHIFVDTTYFYPAELSFNRYTIDSTLYKTADEWTQAHFLGYRLTVQYSVDPAGVVLYSNSDSSVRQGSLQAAEAYSIFFSSDTSIGSWAEYIRFTACGRYGYELYAISDTADMSENIGLYAAILQSITIAPGDHVVSQPAFRRSVSAAGKALKPYACDPLGRTTGMAGASRGLAAGIYIWRNGVKSPFLR